MSKLIEFPQRQHEEFSQLIHKAVKNAASALGIRLDDYIQQIYYQGENPEEFTEKATLDKLYEQYQDLIENTVESVDEATAMSNSKKAYLCYRIYLHGMTIERKVMSEQEAKHYLIRALREFFYAKDKVLSLQDEMNLIELLSLATEQAAPLKY